MNVFIENGILKRCRKDAPGVTIPATVTGIGRSAFDGCGMLKSVTIPDSVTSIGDEAFRWCSSLTSVTIGSGIREIGCAVFRGCYALKKVTVSGVTITIPGKAHSEEIGDICNMILSGDYAVKMAHPVKFAVLAQLFLAGYDEENLFPYIKKNFSKFCAFLIGTGNTAAVTKAIANGKLLTRRNLDKFIELAIEKQQHEIYILLLNCKEETTAPADPTEKLRL